MVSGISPAAAPLPWKAVSQPEAVDVQLATRPPWCICASTEYRYMSSRLNMPDQHRDRYELISCVALPGWQTPEMSRQPPHTPPLHTPLAELHVAPDSSQLKQAAPPLPHFALLSTVMQLPDASVQPAHAVSVHVGAEMPAHTCGPAHTA